MAKTTASMQDLRTSFGFSILLAAAAAIVAALPQPAHGANAQATPQVEREVIPGADKMSSAERETYRRRMQAAATPAEKEKIRAEYTKAAETPLPPALVGDPQRGEKLHPGCFGCHGIERYTHKVTYAMATFTDSVLRASGLSDLPPSEPTRFKGSPKSLAELQAAVMRRNDFLNPKMSPQEVADVVAYLNVTYYNFPQ